MSATAQSAQPTPLWCNVASDPSSSALELPLSSPPETCKNKAFLPFVHQPPMHQDIVIIQIS